MNLNTETNTGLDLLQEPHLPYGQFKPEVRRFVEYTADMFGCPVDYVIAECAIAMGTAIGKKVDFPHGRYHDMPNLWVCLIGAPGINKSAPAAFVLKPVMDYDMELFEGFKAERAKVEAYNKNVSARNRSKEGKANPEQKQPLPKEKAVRLSDATPEKRNEVLANIDGFDLGLLCYYDELAQMFNQMGRYNKSAEGDEMLSMFTGQSIKVSRKKEDTVIIQRPCLSIFGTIQPDRLKEYFGKTEFTGGGFTQRWCFVWPMNAEPPAVDEEDKPADPLIEDDWAHIVHDAFTHDFAGLTLWWDDEAQHIWRNWKRRKRDEWKAYDGCTYMQAVVSKIDIQMFHWLSATHFLCKDFDDLHVTAQEVQQAIEAMEYFQYTTKNVYNKISDERNSGEVNTVNVPTEHEVNTYEAYQKGLSENKSMRQIAKELNVSTPYVSRVVKKVAAYSKEDSESVNHVNRLTK